MFDDNGNEVLRKKIGSNGTAVFEGGHEAWEEMQKQRIAEFSATEEQRKQMQWEEAKMHSSMAAQAFMREIEKNGGEESSSGKIYKKGRKPSRYDYNIGLADFFKKGEQMLAPNNKGGYDLNSWDGQRWRPEKEDYSYKELIKKPDMKLTTLTKTAKKLFNGKIDRRALIQSAGESIAENGGIDEKGLPFVYVDDVGAYISVPNRSLRHGLDDRIWIQSKVYPHLGEILKHSVKINEAIPDPDKDDVKGCYYLIGAGTEQDGRISIVFFVVDTYTNKIDKMYSANTKKEPGGFSPKGFELNSTNSPSSSITIAHLLDLVKDYHPEGLSEDVLDHYKLERGDSKEEVRAIFSQKDTDYLAAVERRDTETAQKMVDAAAERALAGSKARGKDGMLEKVYHGTTELEQINVFRRGKRGNLGPGIYVTTDQAYAKRYANAMGDGGKVYTGYIDLKNPIVCTSSEPAREILRALYGSDTVYNRRIRTQTNAASILTQADIRKGLQKGFDGVVWDLGSKEYAVWNPEQIKSADPVTYDDAGNVIPLSERFDQSKEDFRYSKQDIIMDMDDEARAEILRKKVLFVVDKSEEGVTDQDFDYMSKMALNDAGKHLCEILEKKLFQDYHFDDFDFDARFSKRGLNESLHQQKEHHKPLTDLALALKYMPEIINQSVLIKIQSDKYKGTRRENPNLKAMYILMGGMETKTSIIPVQFEIKAFKQGQKNKIYVVATLDRFDKTKIEAHIVGQADTENQSQPYPPSASTPYMLADVAQAVNPNSGFFFKHLPGQLLTDEQNVSRDAEIREEQRKLGDMRYDQAVKKNQELALEMLAEKRAQSDLPEGVVKLDEITFDDEGKLIPLSKRYDGKNNDPRYSTKDPVDYMAARTAAAMQDNPEFRAIIETLLDDYDRTGADAAVWKKANVKETAKITRGLLRKYGSKYDLQEATDQLTRLYEIMRNGSDAGDAQQTDVLTSMFTLAKSILTESRYKNTELYDQFKDVRDYADALDSIVAIA